MAQIIYTSKDCEVNGERLQKFPIILNAKRHVHHLATDFLIDSYNYDGLSKRSIRTYAFPIYDFVSQMEVDKILLKDINFKYMLSYRSELLKRGVSDSVASDYIRVVITYLMWVEKNGYVTNLIGESNNCAIPITIDNMGRVSQKRLMPNHRGNVMNLNLPTAEAIEIVKSFSTNRHVGTQLRFSLLVDWQYTVGLRAHEVTALNKNQLPCRKTIEKLIDKRNNWYLKLIKTKGGKPRSVPVSPLLLLATLDWIDTHREIIVQRWKRKSRKEQTTFHDPEEIFISETTGQAIVPGTLSNMVRKAYLAAVDAGALTKDERVWSHGLRHNFADTQLRKRREKGQKFPEHIVRMTLGHSDLSATQCYVQGQEMHDDETVTPLQNYEKEKNS